MNNFNIFENEETLHLCSKYLSNQKEKGEIDCRKSSDN